MPPFEIQVLRPSSTYESPSRRAVVASAATSEPASGSDSAKPVMASPATTRGRSAAFCASVPNSDTAPEPRPCIANAKSGRPP